MTLAAQSLACLRSERLVFTDLNFSLKPGAALVLRGPNGSGKTSLLRMIAGFLKPAGGGLTWDGEDVWQDIAMHRRRLGYIGHLDGAKAQLTVAENLRFWTALSGHSLALADALDAFGVSHLADIPVRLLSAGQRKRTALGRLVLSRKNLWLLDEPGVSLDDDGLTRLASVVAGHLSGGGMVIAATHHDLGFEGAEALHLGRSDG